MKAGSQTRLLAILLAVVTLAAFGLSIANLMQESSYAAPTDGVHWAETEGGLRAYIVPKDTPAYRAGIRTGDVLTAIRRGDILSGGYDVPTPKLASLERELERSGIWSHATYTLQRNTVSNRDRKSVV